MSQIVLSPDAAGTGQFTIAAPNSNTNRTLNLPDASGTVFVSGQNLSATAGSFSSNVTLGSSVLSPPSGSAPSYLCRAWVNFNGTGTVAIRSSGNVTSITDNGTGAYTVNFTTAMADADYAVLATGGDNATNYQVAQISSAAAPTTSAVRIQTLIQNSGNPAATDCSRVSVAIFD